MIFVDERNLLIQMISSDSKQEYTVKGTLDKKNKFLKFQELDDQNTTVIILLEEHKIIRKNSEYELTMVFDSKKETDAKMVLANYGKEFFIKIKTIYFQYDKKTLELKYQLVESQEEIEYKINFEERIEVKQ